MPYDFDTPVDRHGTDCIKFDRPELMGRSSDLLSLWVADMDFRTPPEVVDAISERAQHGIFGYSDPGPDYFASIDAWCSKRYGWHVSADQVVTTPGVVYALAAAVRAFTKPGECVLIQQPVYHPFSSVAVANGRALAVAPLSYENDQYQIDFEAFERTVVDNEVKLFLLCNPHNPVGRAWTQGELTQLGEICERHGVLVVSDEIHMDFARPGHAHVPFATLDEGFARRSIVCTSASKTFNLAGLQVANIIIPDQALREAFRATVLSSGFSQPNVLGMVATRAAYEHGGPWLDALKDYLEGNWALLANTLADRAPKLELIEAESTYLAWVDCRALGFDALALERFIEDEAGLWLDCGHMFGAGGEGFVRINIATQRSYLELALARLCDAVGALESD